MQSLIRYSTNILRALSESVSKAPTISTNRGDLYFLSRYSMGAIRLKIPLSEYFDFLESIPENRPKPSWTVPVSNLNFEIVVDANIEVRDGKTFVDGREVVFV